MIKKTFSLGLLLSLYLGITYAQGTFWYENFDGATTKWDNTTFFTAFPAGGPNNANANKWIINNNSPLTSPCGGGNKSLHVTCNSGFLCTLFGPGANYDDGPFNNTQTDRITSSLNITTPASGTINIKFNWLSVGSATDFGRAYYSTNGGITWNLITPMLFNNQPTQTTFTGTLPPSCNGISTLRIGFRWTSDDNGDGVDPSFNIDDIELFTTPPSLVINSVTTNPFCPGDPITINFTGTHTYYSPCNTFTAIMNPGATVIGTLSLSSLTIPTTGTITGTIPISTAPGAYTITVTSSNTAASSATFPITVNSCTNSITTGVVSPIAYCPFHNVIVPFTSNGTFTSGNIFTAQLSDAVGSFATPTNIGTLAMSGTNPSGNIPAGIPGGTPAGIGYRIRVVSSLPPVIGTDNGTNITIYPLPMTSGITPVTAVCVGDNQVYSVTATAGSTYNWSVTGGTVIAGAGTNSVTINWTTAGVQTITVTETNSNGCTGSPITVNITVNSCSTTITTGSINPLSYCVGDAISIPFTTNGTFSAGNIFTAELSNSMGSFATTTTLGTLALSGTNPSGTISGTIPLSTTASNLYRVRVISSAPASTGSDNGANITINQKVNPSIIYKDTVICLGGTGVYTALNNQDTYNWTVSGGGTIVSGSGTPSITVSWTTAGNFTVTMNGTTGVCNNTPAIINVQVITPQPAGVSISPTGACAGQAVLLTANPTNGGPSPTYQWFINGSPVSGATTNTFTTPTTLVAGDIVSVQMTSNGTCVSPLTATAQVVVTNGSIAGMANNNQTICLGQNTLITLVGYSGNIQWQFSMDNVTFTNISGANNDTLFINGLTQTTYYRAEVTTGSCTPNVSNVVQIIVNSKPTAIFTANPNPASLPDATINFTNTSTGASNYQWLFGDGNNSILTSPVHTYTAQGTYTVTLIATSPQGCTDTIRKTIVILPEGSTMFVPNIFTPNSDGFNDVFAPVFQNYTNIKIQIFNRWGNKVYEGNDKWQPTQNMPDGVYTYIITAINRENKTDTRVGTITLLR
jgi:gliding motility-associated-like protein